MSAVIDGLVRKLKTAQGVAKRTRAHYEEAQQAALEWREELGRADAAVDELQRAISLLRNGLKPAIVESGNVTRLNKKD